MEKRIVLVGVGHVFDIAEQIKRVMECVSPDIIALELDTNRFRALRFQERGKNIPFLYKVMGKIQENIANKYGVTTGSEMLAAIEKAEELNITVECIDMDAQHVFRKLLRNIPLRKKATLLIGGITSVFIPKKNVEKEIQLFEANTNQYMNTFEKHFPSIKKILIDDRNSFMANQLQKLLADYHTILCIVGEGHIHGLEHMLRDVASLVIIHLSELREEKWEQSYRRQIQLDISSTASSPI